MNIIANNVASKLFVAFVAAAMLFMLVAPSAKAATAEELQAQITALMAQIAALQGQTGASSAAACTFTRALADGSEGEDVKCLQTYLTPTYFNFAGGATGYFGPVTTAAVAAWQAANGVMPAVGYFGPLSQAKYTALMAAAPVVTPGTDDSTDTTDDTTSGDLGGEATLDKFQSNDGDDTDLEEGQDAESIAEFEVKFTEGDAMITRLDIALEQTVGSETDPWKTFNSVSLFVDGEEVATKSADSKSDYLGDEANGILRFSGLDIVSMEDDSTIITVGASIKSSIDGTSNDWTVTADSMRFIDGSDVTSTESNFEDLGNVGVDFTIADAGGDDELLVKTSTSDPVSTTFELDDASKSGWETVFAWDLDTKDSVNDISVNNIVTTVTIAGIGAASYGDVVYDAELDIDGTIVDDVTVTLSTTTNPGDTAELDFNVDGDVVINAGDRVTAELHIKFKALDPAFEGATIVATTDATDYSAEGADDLAGAQFSGTATGDVHTLRTMGIIAEAGALSAEVQALDGNLNDYATYSVEVDVTAFNQDVYIATNPAAGLTYRLESGAGADLGSIGTPVLDSTADVDGAYYRVSEGSTETFTLTVTYAPGVANTAARLQLLTLEYRDTAAAANQTWDAVPEQDYQTATKTIVN